MLRKDNEHSFINEVREMIVDSLGDLYETKCKFEDLTYVIINNIDKQYLRDKEKSIELCGNFIFAMEDFLDMQDSIGDPYDVDGGLAQLYNDAVIVLAKQMTSFLLCDLSDRNPEEIDNGKIISIDKAFIDKFTDEIYDEFYGKIENFWSHLDIWNHLE